MYNSCQDFGWIKRGGEQQSIAEVATVGSTITDYHFNLVPLLICCWYPWCMDTWLMVPSKNISIRGDHQDRFIAMVHLVVLHAYVKTVDATAYIVI
jgi:hypothetical protein